MPTTTEARRLERLSEETKNTVTEMFHPEVRRAMLEIALGYQELAECARQRGADHSEGDFDRMVGACDDRQLQIALAR